MTVLVTGGCGYIGSNVVAALCLAGYEVAIVDNLETSSLDTFNYLRDAVSDNIKLFEVDITAASALSDCLASVGPDAVIHCAGLKSISDSWKYPTQYFRTNVGGTLNLLQAMEDCECNRLVFSSSATVYGRPESLPIKEAQSCIPVNPYGRSKFMAEQVIEDWQSSNESRAAVSLRYFNPVGAHPVYRLGDNPKLPPNNLFPKVLDVIFGKENCLDIYGDDYPTPDGTGERDYIHISDLSEAHIKALRELSGGEFRALNIGTGNATSVKKIIEMFELHSNQKVPFEIKGRREGDVATVFACNQLSLEYLGNYLNFSLEDAVKSCLRMRTNKDDFSKSSYF